MSEKKKLADVVEKLWDDTSDGLDQFFRRASEFAAKVDAEIERREAANEKRDDIKNKFNDLAKNFYKETAAPAEAPKAESFSAGKQGFGPAPTNESIINDAIIDGSTIKFEYQKYGYDRSEVRELDVTEFDRNAGLVKGTDPTDADQFKTFKLSNIVGSIQAYDV